MTTGLTCSFLWQIWIQWFVVLHYFYIVSVSVQNKSDCRNEFIEMIIYNFVYEDKHLLFAIILGALCRWIWILQDLLGVAFCLNFLKTITLSNFKVTYVFYSGMRCCSCRFDVYLCIFCRSVWFCWVCCSCTTFFLSSSHRSSHPWVSRLSRSLLRACVTLTVHVFMCVISERREHYGAGGSRSRGRRRAGERLHIVSSVCVCVIWVTNRSLWFCL